MKRIVCVLLIFSLVLMSAPAFAAQPNVYTADEGIEYQEGVVARGSTMPFQLFALLEELQVAYLTCDMPGLVSGSPATWTATATGGDGEYEYEFYIFYRSGNEGLLYMRDHQARSAANTFTHTPEFVSGQYMIKVFVYDSMGEYLEWNSQIFETSKKGDETNTATVPGKVAYLAKQCVSEAGESDFARALWLHDWLINHAEYDLTYTYYYPEGVLLRGTGVCQSYALAYELLLNAVGIDSLYITGEAGGGGHAWNLVKLNGSWYHIDCTWDDPVGGTECHTYFALTDAEMRRDHVWTGENGLLPECNSTECDYENVVFATNTASVSEGLSKLTALINAGGSYAYLVFETEEMAASFCNQAYEKIKSLVQHGTLVRGKAEKRFEVYRENGSTWTLTYGEGAADARVCEIYFDYGRGYEIPTTAQYVNLISKSVSLDPGETCRLSLYCVPSNGTGLSWTSADNAIATVVNGVVTAKKSGVTDITVTTVNGETSTCRVYVLTDARTVIPASVARIEAEAFYGCAGIQTLVIEEGVQGIGASAFAACHALLTAHLPASLTAISASAFDGCEGLTIVCPENSYAETFAKQNGIPVRYE